MRVIYHRPRALSDAHTHYCPGCTHGIAHRLVAEVMDELGIVDRTIGVASVGCSVFAYNYLRCDFQQAAHGRAPAVATGIKRVLPDRVVFTYQGDGDLASIGTAEIIHAAARGERITVIFINNGIYGMTGGQMAPTSLAGQVTTTSPRGRDPQLQGNPIRITEMLAQQPGVAYLARGSLHSSREIGRARRMVQRAFEAQLNDAGFAMVELLSSCPVGWNMTPRQALEHIEQAVVPVYPVGELVPAPPSRGASDGRHGKGGSDHA
ncbi:thiamine pyrophosphate-dependent enzyme [Limnochorda pilosa]|uniref:MFS transporter n=1 Tax=Limnochorda pilosa TaxID=1555112 RepID=A0A0K2SPS9_LIMPI|nr:MFS transporter [Limnochorda pilosa]